MGEIVGAARCRARRLGVGGRGGAALHIKQRRRNMGIRLRFIEPVNKHGDTHNEIILVLGDERNTEC